MSLVRENERVYRMQQAECRRVIADHDEEFAQFVFYHFGGYWLRTADALLASETETMRLLPKRISDRVTALAREHELKRGGP